MKVMVCDWLENLRSAMTEIGGGSGRAGFLGSEKFMKVSGLGGAGVKC